MQGWRKVLSLADAYKAELKKVLLLRNGIEAIVESKARTNRLAADLDVREGQYEIASILLFENEED